MSWYSLWLYVRVVDFVTVPTAHDAIDFSLPITLRTQRINLLEALESRNINAPTGSPGGV
jgi:hypothetical protein